MSRTTKKVIDYTPEEERASFEFALKAETLIEVAKKAGMKRVEIKVRTKLGSKLDYLWSDAENGEGAAP